MDTILVRDINFDNCDFMAKLPPLGKTFHFMAKPPLFNQTFNLQNLFTFWLNLYLLAKPIYS